VAQLADQPPVVQRRVIRKVTVRLVPFLGLLYVINYLDRVNVGFAALTMNADLGPQCRELRAGCRVVLHRLLLLRSAQQHHPAPGGRPGVDRPDHDL
jgi:hypothetical protein